MKALFFILFLILAPSFSYAAECQKWADALQEGKSQVPDLKITTLSPEQTLTVLNSYNKAAEENKIADQIYVARSRDFRGQDKTVMAMVIFTDKGCVLGHIFVANAFLETILHGNNT